MPVLATAPAQAQKIGQVERGTGRGARYDVLVLTLPMPVDSVMSRARRAAVDESFTVRLAADSIVEASRTRPGACPSPDGKVPFVIQGSQVPRTECRLSISIHLAPDSIGTRLWLSGMESSDEPSRAQYRLTRSSQSWKVLENLARAISQSTKR